MQEVVACNHVWKLKFINTHVKYYKCEKCGIRGVETKDGIEVKV